VINENIARNSVFRKVSVTVYSEVKVQIVARSLGPIYGGNEVSALSI